MNARMAQHFDRVECAQMTARMRGKWSSVAVELIAAVRLIIQTPTKGGRYAEQVEGIAAGAAPKIGSRA
jgi:hypothetical protein